MSHHLTTDLGGEANICQNVQPETNQHEENGLVYNHDEARVLVTVITTFNDHMECIVKQHRQQHVVTLVIEPRPQLIRDEAATQ